MGSKDAVLGRQVFVAQQQFLIDEAGHKGQEACPLKSIVHGGTFMINNAVHSPQPSTSTHRPSILTKRALLDRLVERAIILKIKGKTYRTPLVKSEDNPA